MRARCAGSSSTFSPSRFARRDCADRVDFRDQRTCGARSRRASGRIVYDGKIRADPGATTLHDFRGAFEDPLKCHSPITTESRNALCVEKPGLAFLAGDFAGKPLLTIRVVAGLYVVVALAGFLTSGSMLRGFVHINVADRWLHAVLAADFDGILDDWQSRFTGGTSPGARSVSPSWIGPRMRRMHRFTRRSWGARL